MGKWATYRKRGCGGTPPTGTGPDTYPAPTADLWFLEQSGFSESGEVITPSDPTLAGVATVNCYYSFDSDPETLFDNTGFNAATDTPEGAIGQQVNAWVQWADVGGSPLSPLSLPKSIILT